MLWTLGKVVFFLAIVAGLAFGALNLAQIGGEFRLWAFNHEFTVGPLTACFLAVALVILVWIGLKLLGLLLATWRFLNGDETAVTRYFDRNRERRGYAALSEGMIALASGEPVLAMARARTAERLLKKPEVTLLLTAQAAEAAGDRKLATDSWKALLGDERTRFVAVRGLLRQKLAEGDTATALKLAERAFALKPRHAETQDILLKLQAEGGDWKGARLTLSEKLRSGALPRSLYRRRDALLALQEAKTIMDEGSSIEAREAAIEANKLSPDLIPAAAIAARALTEKGDGKAATRILKKAWEAQPHPDLAAAFAEIEPNETPAERLKRFRSLLSRNPSHEESLQTEAELLIANGDFAEARRVLGDLPERQPTQRSLALLAAAERGLGAPEADLREMLARALAAPTGPQWCCDACGTALEDWRPICPSCNGFDTLSWRIPDAAHAVNASRSDLARLILGPERENALPFRVEEAETVENTGFPAAEPPRTAPPESLAKPEVEAAPPSPRRPDEAAATEEPELTPDEILRRAN